LAKALFGWFSPKRGEDVLVMVEKHLELTRNTVYDLHKMVDAAAACNLELCASSFMNLSKMEMEADELRRQMVDALTVSEMFPEERDDLMEMVRAVDWIADWSKEAGRILNVIQFDKAPPEIKEAALNMCHANLDCVSVLEDCVKQLLKDPKEAISLANKVELLEEDMDELYGIARKYLATLDFPGWNMGSMILLGEFLNALETIADWSENTADIVRAVAVRRK
jgi:predicted phosphate transport protein (TIGR00153 family)